MVSLAPRGLFELDAVRGYQTMEIQMGGSSFEMIVSAIESVFASLEWFGYRSTRADFPTLPR